jgi:hypothetical protein
LYILVSRTIDESGLAGVAAAGRYFQCSLGLKPASRAVARAIQKSANAGVRPFDLARQAVKGLAKETLEWHREAGGLRVALTTSAGFESIEMSRPVDAHIARYAAAAILPNHQQ